MTSNRAMFSQSSTTADRLFACRDLGRANVDVTLFEMRDDGPALVRAIMACLEIEPVGNDSNRHIATGTFHHSAGNLIEVHVEGEADQIGVTDNHLFWSESRHQFIPAGQLIIGEQLRQADGTIRRVSKIHPRRGPPVPVFNLEVDAQHVYFVSANGTLVHNGYASKLKYHYTDAPEESFRNGLWSHSSVTDNPNLTAREAIERLGVKRPPNKVIPIRDSGNFVPNSPHIVDPHPLGPGGGTDFINLEKIPGHDILPARPIKSDGAS